jgi:hypothetical protein
MEESQISMQKWMLWEQAKGALRAMVAAEGFRRLCDPMTVELEKTYFSHWQKLSADVENMIAHAEDNGWPE